MSLSPVETAKACVQRADDQNWRLLKYAELESVYDDGRESGGGGVRGSYGDGRPALQDLSDFRSRLQARRGAPNWVRPIVDARVAATCELPTISFDQADDTPESEKTAVLASRAVRGQYELSNMAVGFVYASQFATLFGEVGYTLDPLRPADAKKLKDPFATPGVYINVLDPTHCFPRFGTGNQHNRVQDMFLFYRDLTPDEVESHYPDALGKIRPAEKYSIAVHYTAEYKLAVVFANEDAVEVYRDDHDYGFCPAEWGVNKVHKSEFGVSEIEGTSDLHRTSQSMFHLAFDGAIMQTFPPIHVHQPEHVGRMKYGPLAVIETVEDGKVETLVSYVDTQVPTRLLEVAKGNLLTQTGTSPLSQNQNIEHANTSGRAINSAQSAGQDRINLTNTLQGSTLEWLNAKIAMILYKDSAFKNEEMTVYGVQEKTKRTTVTFKGDDLGGLWRNHVQWGSQAGNKHETEVMYLQLYKDNLIPGRKVLEAMGEDDPERLIAEARAEKAAMQPPGGPPGAGGPTPPGGAPPGAAEAGAALGAGAMPGGPALPGGGGGASAPATGPVQPPPPTPSISGFSPVAGAPGGPPGGASPVPDIKAEVDAIASGLKLHGEIVSVTTIPTPDGVPRGILVAVTDHKDFAILKTALRSVAEEVAGPGAKVEVTIPEAMKNKKG